MSLPPHPTTPLAYSFVTNVDEMEGVMQHWPRRVTTDVFAMIVLGALAGLALGMASVRYIEALLYQVKPGDPEMLVIPSLTILVAALLAALPAVFHAIRIDPVNMLRAD